MLIILMLSPFLVIVGLMIWAMWAKRTYQSPNPCREICDGFDTVMPDE